MFEVPMPDGWKPNNFTQPEPVKVSETEFLIPIYANGRQRVILWEFGAATSQDVTPAIATTARGALYAGDNAVWLCSWQDTADGPRLLWQQVGSYKPYRAPQGVTVADVRGVVLEALRGLLFDVEAIRKLLRW